jgi:hypothetical protein
VYSRPLRYGHSGDRKTPWRTWPSRPYTGFLPGCSPTPNLPDAQMFTTHAYHEQSSELFHRSSRQHSKMRHKRATAHRLPRTTPKPPQIESSPVSAPKTTIPSTSCPSIPHPHPVSAENRCLKPLALPRLRFPQPRRISVYITALPPCAPPCDETPRESTAKSIGLLAFQPSRSKMRIMQRCARDNPHALDFPEVLLQYVLSVLQAQQIITKST